MKTIICILMFIFWITSDAYSIGVAIVDAKEQQYLKLIESKVIVNVENQIAIVTSTQVFKNIYNDSVNVRYAFPLPDGASSISLKLKYNNHWYIANISEDIQDTNSSGGGGGGGGGSSVKTNLDKYLGKFPVYFDIADKIKADSTLTVEISYVQLLNYEWGRVKFEYDGDYSLIQKDTVDFQTFGFSIFSQKTIEELVLENDLIYQIETSTNRKGLKTVIRNKPVTEKYKVEYKLSTEEMGIFAFSNYLRIAPDSANRGFLLFVAEPDASNKTDALQKRFTLIIDKSGSMSGYKIVQARNAARFIVNHLNENDMFNIFDFDDNIHSFRSSHVPFNLQNKTAALDYIDGLDADGLTNISGVFNEALAQFPDTSSSESKEMASIILFFTDGRPTAGICDIDELIDFIKDKNHDKNVTIYTFGIGHDVNKRLLTYIADDNNGLAAFVNDNELEKTISNFYLTIRNPVLINPTVSFSPSIIDEVFPKHLQNLYKGHQLMITGRYSEPANPLKIKLAGTAFGKKVEYEYEINLANSREQKYDFLSKVWAKMKIDYLLNEYNKYDENSTEAKKIKDTVVFISLRFKIITPFTTYKGQEVYVIPVEMIAFMAEVRNNKIILNWATASENNNYGFYIERRVKGEKNWERIGFVKGSGNSNKKVYYYYEDVTAQLYRTYQYRLVQIDFDGTGFYENNSDILTVTFNVNIETELFQNYPNPFSNTTRINYTLAKDANVKIDILDINGRIIKNIVNDYKNAGEFTCEWDGHDAANSYLPSGNYICRFVAGNDVKFIILTLNK